MSKMGLDKQTNTYTHTSGHQWLRTKFPFKGSPSGQTADIIQGLFEVSSGSAAASGISALRVIGEEKRCLSAPARGGEAAPGGPNAFRTPLGKSGVALSHSCTRRSLCGRGHCRTRLFTLDTPQRSPQLRQESSVYARRKNILEQSAFIHRKLSLI